MNPASWTLDESFTLPNWGSGMSVLASLDRIVFLSSDFNTPFLAHMNFFSITGRQQLAQVDIRTASPGCADLVWCGEDRFAFRTPTEIVVVRSSTVPSISNPAPLFLGLSKDPTSDSPRLNLQTAPGYWYSIESSSDLEHWTPITNFLGNAAATTVIDPGAQASGARFYRAIRW